jgi:hypothetical protein
MRFSTLWLFSLLAAAGSALAHPGHGKPGFLHSHSLADLESWVANGALALYAIVVLGLACYGAARLWNSYRRKAKRDDPR